MAPTALLIGGTGPTGPPIAAGLEARGHEVTLFHSGRHEVAEVAHLRHLHGDAFAEASLAEGLGDETFDVVVAAYGRLRAIAELLVGRVGRFLSIGGVPVYQGYFDPDTHDPPGLPVPTGEDAPLATEADDGKSYRIGRTEEIVFDHHPTATHFRYPFVYGPRQLVPREWCIVRRILDGRPFLVLADDGLTLVTHGYVENLAHALLLAVDQPEASMGETFNCGDEECLTVRQVAEILADELGHDVGGDRDAGRAGHPGPAADDEPPEHRTGSWTWPSSATASATGMSCRLARPSGARAAGWSTTGPSRAAPRRSCSRTPSTTPPKTAWSTGGERRPPTRPSSATRAHRATAWPTAAPAPPSSAPTSASELVLHRGASTAASAVTTRPPSPPCRSRGSSPERAASGPVRVRPEARASACMG